MPNRRMIFLRVWFSRHNFMPMETAVLLARIETLERQFQGQNEEVSFLKKQNVSLKKENAHLKERLAKLENPKNSRNSSVPPSKDENRPKPNQSLRKPSTKKPGGQKGRQGKTLEMSKNPDVIVDLEPERCTGCGASLGEVPATKEQSRQVVDIPPIKAIYTEYRTFSKTCGCGCRNVPDFPSAANAPVSYGENIEALVGYFHARQYLPFDRMRETLKDVFGTSISEGGIHRLLNRFAQKTTPFYQIIKQRVEKSTVVGADETGVKVNGEKNWIWTWQTPKLTYIAYSDNRGSATVEKEFPKGLPKSFLGRDDWAAQAKTPAKGHQTCVAHLLRRLNYLRQIYPDDRWAAQFRKLLYDSLKLKREMDFKNPLQPKRDAIIERFEYLLDNPPQKGNKKLYAFFKTRFRDKSSLFTFLFHRDVPPDNNGSERAIRNVKVKQKISGQFKTEASAKNFAKIRSVIDTTIKNGMNVLEALSLIAKFDLQTID